MRGSDLWCISIFSGPKALPCRIQVARINWRASVFLSVQLKLRRRHGKKEPDASELLTH